MSTLIALLFTGSLFVAFAQFWSERRGSTHGPAWAVLAAATSFFAGVTVASWLLSLVHAWTQTGLALTGLAVLLFLRLRLVSPGLAYAREEMHTGWARLTPTERWSFGALGACFLLNVGRSYLLPPLNIDSYSIHLARPFTWFFTSSITPIANYHEIPNIYPISVHVFLGAWLKLAGSDLLIELIAIVSYQVLFLATRGILLECGLERRAATTGALLVVTMPILILCSVTTQVDLPALMFCALAVYFLFSVERNPCYANLFLAGTSTGLAIGAKPQGVIIGALLLACAGGLFLARRAPLSQFVVLYGTTALLACPGYLFNFVHTGSFFPLKMEAARFGFSRFITNWTIVYPKFLFVFPFDFFPFHFFNHDQSNYGPAFTILLLLLPITRFLRRDKSRLAVTPRRILGVCLVGSLLFLSLTWHQEEYRWDVRIMVYCVYFAFVLLAGSYGAWLGRGRLAGLALLYSVGSLVLISSLDMQSGVSSIRKASLLPEQDRTFAAISPIGIRPPAFFEKYIHESHLTDGPAVLMRKAFTNDAVAVLAGSGPAREVFYAQGGDDRPSELDQRLAAIRDYATRRKCRWLLIDSALTQVHARLAENTVVFRPALVDSAYGVLYHVDAPELLGDRPSTASLTRAHERPHVIVDPAIVTGSTGKVKITVDRSAGVALTRAYLMLAPMFRYDHACVVRYDPEGDNLWLFDDSGTSWQNPTKPGSPVMLANSQCSVDVGATRVEQSGQRLTVVFPLSFHRTLTGTNLVFAEAQDNAGGDSGWQALAKWKIP